MWPFDNRSDKKAFNLLGRALTESDDVAYLKLVCEAAEIADKLEKSSSKRALTVWAEIAQLDGNRARAHELVDHARAKLLAADIEGPPTIVAEYQDYLRSLPEAQRALTHVRYLHRVITSNVAASDAKRVAAEAIGILQAYERSNPLTKKQLAMKHTFQEVLRRNA